MASIVTYELNTGRVIQVHSTKLSPISWEGAELCKDAWPFPHVAPLEIMHTDLDIDPALYYVRPDNTLQLRMPFPVLQISNGLVRGVPRGTTVHWPDHAETLETDGEFELMSNVGGTFRFRLDHPWYTPYTLELSYHV